MMRLYMVAVRNLSRNWFRTILTVAGAAVALISFIMIRTLLEAWNVGADNAAVDRLGTRHKVTFVMPLPKTYINDVRNVPGVTAATWANWFGARIPNKPNEFFASLAVEAPSYLQVIDEMVLTPADKERWLGDKRGAVVGDVLAKKMGWKVGDKVILEGTIFPGDWEFTVDGIYTATRKSLDRSQFLFHWDYLNDSIPEARREKIGWISTRVADSSKSGDIAASIDKVFDSRDTQTVSMSEHAMQTSFMAMFSALLSALNIVSAVILVIMLLILGNTIAMGVRERTREYAVLRAIGFKRKHVRFFVIAEATTLGLISGLVGVGIAIPFVTGVIGRALEENMGGWFPYFRVGNATAVIALMIAIGLALFASLLPSMRVARLSVVEALRRVG
jgi:putative ABC transport system permease protein